MNGMITYNRKHQPIDSNSTVNLDQSNFRSLNQQVNSSPKLMKESTPNLQRAVKKTIKSSVVNGRDKAFKSKQKDGAHTNIFKEYARKPSKKFVDKENFNSRSQSEILVDITDNHLNIGKASKGQSNNTSRLLNDIETETRDMLKGMSYIEMQPHEVTVIF